MAVRVKKKSAARVTTPTPLVQAVGRQPAKGGVWTVTDSGQRPAHTDLHRGMLSVPLTDTDEPCPKCKTPNHNDAIRTHELIHVRVSPTELDRITVPQAYIDDLKDNFGNINIGHNLASSLAQHQWELHTSDPKTDTHVEPEVIVVAEEFGVEHIRMQINRRSRNGYSDYVCVPNFKKSYIELLSQRKVKDAALLACAAGPANRNIENILYKISNGVYLASYQKKDKELYSYMTIHAREIWTLHNLLSTLTGYIQRAFSKNEWHRANRLARAVAIHLYINKLKKKQNTTPQSIRELAKEEGIDEDLMEGLTHFEKQAPELIQHELEQMRKHRIEQVEHKSSKPIGWANMEIVRPPLVKKLPTWKLQRRNAPTDEGTIPTYMHRFAVDQRVFRRTTRDYGASILIDDSGSMGFSTEELDQLIEQVPGLIVAAYAGSRMEGRLKILAEGGKRVAASELKVGYGGNEVDLPALEWLAKQPAPRIWVSDGQVVSPTHGFTPQVALVCYKFAAANKINRAEDVEEARLMLTGKKEVYR